MISLQDADVPDTMVTEAPPAVNVLLLYQDADTAVDAKQLIDQLVEHVNLVVSFNLNLCRFDLLNVSAVRQLAGEDPLDSDIVVLAVHGHDGLPQGVRSWLDRWFASRSDRDRALVVSMDACARASAAARQIECALQAAGLRSGVEVFAHFGESEYSELDSAIAGIRYRAETTSGLLNETLQRFGSESYRGWGIND